MEKAEILKRLDKAREIIETFPEDADILSVMIEEYHMDSIQLHDSWQKLIDAGIVTTEMATAPMIPHSKGCGINIEGFDIFQTTATATVEKKAVSNDVNVNDAGNGRSRKEQAPKSGYPDYIWKHLRSSHEDNRKRKGYTGEAAAR